MNQTDSKIAKLLRKQGVLEPFEYQSALDYASDRKRKFHMALLDLGLVSEEKVVTAVSQVTGMPKVALEKMKVDLDALQALSGEFCAVNEVYPCAVRDQGKTLWLAMADPTDIKVRNAARAQSGMEIRPLVGRPSEISRHIQDRYIDQQNQDEEYVVGAIDLSLSEEEEQEEEFKITDMSGSTAVKHTGDIQSAAKPMPHATTSQKNLGSKPQATEAVSPKLHKRVDRLIEYQIKAERIFRGFVRLLVDKGLISADEFRDRMNK